MATDWNARYENSDTPWDKGFASPPLVEFLERRPLSGAVLVPGCGTGHDVRVLAEQGASVVGMDIAPGALRKAASFESVADERYVLGDFLNLESDFVGRFDAVFEHTCLCALEPSQRSEYAASVVRALKPGGFYLAVFFLEVMDPDGAGPPYGIDAAEIDALFGGYFDVVSRMTPSRFYPSRHLGAEEVVLFKQRLA